jgi:glucokinase
MDLIADIGATNSRCALLDDRGRVLTPETFRTVDFTGVEGLLAAYLEHRRASDQPRRAALAIAAPILGDHVRMTNIAWEFSQSELQSRFGLHRLVVVNDFSAVAWALPDISDADRTPIGNATPVPRATVAALGPGSGLGVASLVATLDSWAIAGGEGGHVTLPATNEDEAAAIALIREDLGHCSAERVLSGPGLVNLYVALSRLAGRGTPTVTAADVTGLARQGEPLAKKTQGMFFAMLGTVASDLALTVGARGGVYIGGGIVPQLLDPLARSGFRARFEDKGRYSDYLKAIPTYVITEKLPALRGLSRLLGYR